MLGAALKEFGTEIKAGNHEYRVVDKHNGPIYILQQESIICGVMHCSDSAKADAYLRLLQQSFSKKEQ